MKIIKVGLSNEKTREYIKDNKIRKIKCSNCKCKFEYKNSERVGAFYLPTIKCPCCNKNILTNWEYKGQVLD